MSKINVLFIASESVPFIKTGGLADVVGSLPKYFDRENYDVRVMMPKYLCIPEQYREKMTFLFSFTTGFHFQDQYVGVLKLEEGGVPFYFIDSEYYFGGNWPYDSMYNDIEKFSFFCHAALSAVRQLDWKPDILHCHDWQGGMVPVYLNDYFQGDLFYCRMKTVMTIHNLRFKGLYDVPTVKDKTGLSDYYFTPDKMELNRNGSLLKGGLVYSDIITTVSKTYAEEIRTPYYGEELDGLLNAKSEKLYGILNGIDTESYDPKNDAAIHVHYDAEDFMSGKAENKRLLQKELGLPEDKDALLISVVSRLTDQKGIDLITCVLNEIMDLHVQFVVLGSGEARYENAFRFAQDRYPNAFRACIFYSEALSRRIYAGSDVCLMPSKFEPCGLTQLLALRYGSLPIVRETGGLVDTVSPYNEYEESGTGFSFTNYNAHDMLNVIRLADRIYHKKRKSWDSMVKRAMEADFSWNNSARSYEALYRKLYEEKLAEEAAFSGKIVKEKIKKAPAKKPVRTAEKETGKPAEKTSVKKKAPAKKTARKEDKT